MTPFALQLRAIRAAYGLAQGEFAARIGYRQSYVSAIECGSKLPKDMELVERTIAALGLDRAGATDLREAFRRSQRYDFPPPGTPAFAYDVCAKLSDVIPRLTQADARALYEVLSLLDRAQQPKTAVAPEPAQRAA
ncbi:MULTISPECIES: helix-turn-helix transcriptional regulator [Burkholderia]|uniref:helix-turn-helix domain-containing protein n=1 Tax=Burkholderia TaxID=32008 RepID=UPI000F01D419|nr:MULTISPECIES: helix-turn-helix transcriptional regulator [Burkholderia]TCW73200.1 XRE family transcriptional regulator [Burkholderia sp. SRS-25]